MSDVAPTWFNPCANLEIWRNRLPHWDQFGGTYFITFRLADAVPAELQKRWQAERDDWLRAHPPPLTPELEQDYHKRFSARLDHWLDAGHGAGLLRDAISASVVAATLTHDDPTHCSLWSWVVMPNHVHVLVSLRAAHGLDALIKTWKGVSARRLNLHRGEVGSVWQRDYFDRLVRDETHFGHCVRYIRQNPVRAKLPPGEFLHWESDLAKMF